LISVGEFETGLAWGVPFRKPTPGGGNPPGILWIRGGLVAQIWGGLGLMNPPVNSTLQGGSFAENPLVLYGFTIQAGLNF
jgi:hypothetical protein